MGRDRFITICQVARLVTLAILFGGSISVVFAAITFVKAAQLDGMSIAQAASLNAPVFLQFSKVATVAACVLLVSELANYALVRKMSRCRAIGYAASVLCFVATLVFAEGIVPSMEVLRPQIKENVAAYTAFKKLHSTSEIVFAGTILFALVSLLAPAFKKEE